MEKNAEKDWQKDLEFKSLDEKLANSGERFDEMTYGTKAAVQGEADTAGERQRPKEQEKPEIHKVREPIGEETRLLDAALVLERMSTGFEDDAQDVVDEISMDDADEDMDFYEEYAGGFGEEEDEDDEEAEYEEYALGGRDSRGGQGGSWQRFLHRQRQKTVMDWVVTLTGIVVVVFAAVTGTIYMAARNTKMEVASFREVGSDLAEVEVIGESGLLAVTEATLARLNAYMEPEPEEEEPIEDTADLQEQIPVGMKLSSIQKDLKIKFVNRNTDKLIASVPFAVEIKGPDGAVTARSDDDMDGIIYLSGITPGKYTVAMKPISGYDRYVISEESMGVTVKEAIEYKKVDVVDEVKTEAEVNVAVEDTKQQETVVESVLKDTVEWVESTRNENAATYTEVKKSDVPDPATLAKALLRGAFWTSRATGTRTEEKEIVSGNETVTVTVEKATVLEIPDAVAVKQGESVTLSVTMENIDSSDVALEISDSTVAAVSRDGAALTVKGNKEGETTLKVRCQELSVTCKITVSKDPVKVTVNQTSASVKAGGSVTLKASVANFKSDSGVVWTSSDTAVATVTDGGVVTGVKAGKVTITAKSKEDNAAAATCEVTVTGGLGVALDQASLTLYRGKTAEIKAKVTDHSSSDKVTYASSDTSIATVSDKGVVTGVKKGKATITVTCEEDKNVKATCEVTVKESAEEDTGSKLKDKNGSQLYYKDDNGEYHEASYADYYKYDIFYLKSATYVYTGWQTLDNTVYFFDKNGNKVTGEQIIQGAKYTFSDSGALVTGTGAFGIDVSKHNGTIDWNAVKNSGVSYVIIRCGYRGSTTGALIEDPKFKSNIAGAQAAGLKVGIYFFTQALNEAEAVEEASMVIDLIKPYHISYPVYLDVEPSGGRADGISREMRTAVCTAFCATMANSGYTSGIYANKTWLNEKINAGALGSYKIWLAQYAAAPTYSGTYHMWQYSSKGSVSGISGNVDMNLSYLGY